MQNWEWGREEMWVPNSRRNDETFIKRDSLWIEAAVHSSIEQRKHNFTAVKYEVLVSFCVWVCVCVHIYIPAVAIPFRIESVLPVSESGWATARALTYLDLHRERDETLNGNQSECTRLQWVLALFFLLHFWLVHSLNGLVEKKKKAQRCEYRFSCNVSSCRPLTW
jgi:hypothetical protein